MMNRSGGESENEDHEGNRSRAARRMVMIAVGSEDSEDDQDKFDRFGDDESGMSSAIHSAREHIRITTEAKSLVHDDAEEDVFSNLNDDVKTETVSSVFEEETGGAEDEYEFDDLEYDTHLDEQEKSDLVGSRSDGKVLAPRVVVQRAAPPVDVQKKGIAQSAAQADAIVASSLRRKQRRQPQQQHEVNPQQPQNHSQNKPASPKFARNAGSESTRSSPGTRVMVMEESSPTSHRLRRNGTSKKQGSNSSTVPPQIAASPSSSSSAVFSAASATFKSAASAAAAAALAATESLANNNGGTSGSATRSTHAGSIGGSTSRSASGNGGGGASSSRSAASTTGDNDGSHTSYTGTTIPTKPSGREATGSVARTPMRSGATHGDDRTHTPPSQQRRVEFKQLDRLENDNGPTTVTASKASYDPPGVEPNRNSPTATTPQGKETGTHGDDEYSSPLSLALEAIAEVADYFNPMILDDKDAQRRIHTNDRTFTKGEQKTAHNSPSASNLKTPDREPSQNKSHSQQQQRQNQQSNGNLSRVSIELPLAEEEAEEEEDNHCSPTRRSMEKAAAAACGHGGLVSQRGGSGIRNAAMYPCVDPSDQSFGRSDSLYTTDSSFIGRQRPRQKRRDSSPFSPQSSMQSEDSSTFGAGSRPPSSTPSTPRSTLWEKAAAYKSRATPNSPGSDDEQNGANSPPSNGRGTTGGRGSIEKLEPGSNPSTPSASTAKTGSDTRRNTPQTNNQADGGNRVNHPSNASPVTRTNKNKADVHDGGPQASTKVTNPTSSPAATSQAPPPPFPTNGPSPTAASLSGPASVSSASCRRGAVSPENDEGFTPMARMRHELNRRQLDASFRPVSPEEERPPSKVPQATTNPTENVVSGVSPPVSESNTHQSAEEKFICDKHKKWRERRKEAEREEAAELLSDDEYDLLTRSSDANYRPSSRSYNRSSRRMQRLRQMRQKYSLGGGRDDEGHSSDAFSRDDDALSTTTNKDKDSCSVLASPASMAKVLVPQAKLLQQMVKNNCGNVHDVTDDEDDDFEDDDRDGGNYSDDHYSSGGDNGVIYSSDENNNPTDLPRSSTRRSPSNTSSPKSGILRTKQSEDNPAEASNNEIRGYSVLRTQPPLSPHNASASSSKQQQTESLRKQLPPSGRTSVMSGSIRTGNENPHAAVSPSGSTPRTENSRRGEHLQKPQQEPHQVRSPETGKIEATHESPTPQRRIESDRMGGEDVRESATDPRAVAAAMNARPVAPSPTKETQPASVSPIAESRTLADEDRSRRSNGKEREEEVGESGSKGSERKTKPVSEDNEHGRRNDGLLSEYFSRDEMERNEVFAQLTGEGVPLLWHQPSDGKNLIRPIYVRARVELGENQHHGIEGSRLEPILGWVGTAEGEGGDEMTSFGGAVALFDVISIERAEVFNLRPYPFAMSGTSFLVALHHGDVLMFESSSAEEQLKIMSTLRRIISRLCYSLVSSNRQISSELIGGRDQADEATVDPLSHSAAIDLLNNLVDKCVTRARQAA